MKKFIKVLGIVLITLYIISSGIFYINFYTIPNRIVLNRKLDISILQTENDYFYEIDDLNSNKIFSQETSYRISNLYTIEEEKAKIKAYKYDFEFTPFFLYLVPCKLNAEVIGDDSYIYYEESTSKRLAFYAKKDLELPQIREENVEKILIYSDTTLVSSIEAEDEISYFFNHYIEEFNKLDSKYEGQYGCYFYYKNSNFYEEVTYDYLSSLL